MAPRAGTPGFRAPEVLTKCPNQGTGQYFKLLLTDMINNNMNTYTHRAHTVQSSHMPPLILIQLLQMEIEKVCVCGKKKGLFSPAVTNVHYCTLPCLIILHCSHRHVVSWCDPALTAQWSLPILQGQRRPDRSYSDHDHTGLQRDHPGCQIIWCVLVFFTSELEASASLL